MQPVQHRHGSGYGSSLAGQSITRPRRQRLREPMDLAPTFLDAAGVDHPPGMAGDSIVPLLESTDSGRIQERRDFVVTGRERHTVSREGGLPYPIRALRTDDFLYIHNSSLTAGLRETPWLGRCQCGAAALGRHQDGHPDGIRRHRPGPNQGMDDLQPGERRCEASSLNWALASGPREELYDLRNDPDYMQNVAYDSEYEHIRAALHSRLMSALKEQDDPRITESPPRFEQPPYAGPVSEEWDVENRRWLAARDPRLFANVYGGR